MIARWRQGGAMALVAVLALGSGVAVRAQAAQTPAAMTRVADGSAPTRLAPPDKAQSPKPKAEPPSPRLRRSAGASAKAEAESPKPAQPAVNAKLPAARTIIDRHLAAIGGRAALLARSSTHATGTVSIPSAGMTGSVDIYAAKQDKSLLRITLGQIGSIEEGFDGTTGWSVSPMTGPSLMQGKELEQKRFDSDFFADVHPAERYESITTVEQLTFDGRPCYKLRLVRRGGAEEFEFYDVATGLKAGAIATRDTPMGPVSGTSVETDYRRFGPLLQPTTITQTAVGVSQVITLTAIEYDNVPSSTFELPAAIKALVK